MLRRSKQINQNLTFGITDQGVESMFPNENFFPGAENFGELIDKTGFLNEAGHNRAPDLFQETILNQVVQDLPQINQQQPEQPDQAQIEKEPEQPDQTKIDSNLFTK